MSLTRALGRAFRIDVQRDASNFAPIRTFGIGIQQAEIGNQVFEAIGRQYRIGGRHVGDVRVERQLSHNVS
ncbi:hypothetical protein GCM10007857_32340 [Bradyrhizobium iriomotense]|uniref:Uncharacterized protein n=1 Tax=Bradyrhizobium iriomotense TaxID=441950 RepID=A0ABQ6AYB8_9BRAD|nr:hypothetical protein GCM10007857_32340 [Bradyrhizobium iriomotense]